MKVIAHRGAAGLALENTIEAIKAGLKLRVDAIEVDVRKTRDDHLVLSHDADITAVASDPRRIDMLTLKQLKKIKLLNGETIPTLADALKIVGKTTLVIDMKITGCLPQLIKVLDQFPKNKISVTSFKHDEMRELKDLRPNLKVFFSEHTKILDTLQKVRSMRIDGLSLNFWLLNPLTYWLARRAELEIMTYTVNNRWLGWWISVIYPHVSIITDYPNVILHR